MSSDTKLKVVAREGTGKGYARELRRQGMIPGVYYYHGQEAKAISVDVKLFHTIASGKGSVVDLQIGRAKILPSIIRDIQWDPLTGHPLHVDFMGVNLDEKIVVEVPLHFVGTSTGVKNKGGVLQTMIRAVEVECLPLEIPDFIDVDLTDLDIHDSVHVGVLKADKVKIVSDPDSVIVTVVPPRLEVEEVPEEVEAGEEQEEPEVVSKGKKEEEAAE